MVELEDLLVRPGTYFNPQTEVVVVVDDSTSIDQEVFNMEAFEGADWVRISDEVPVDADALDTAMERFQTHHATLPAGSRSQATELEPDDDELVEDEEELEPTPTRRSRVSVGYSIAQPRAGASTGWPTTRASARCATTRRRSAREQVSFSWRLMPPGTGGRGSYGHRHPGQEEVYFVVSGTLTFKVGDDVFEAGPQTAVRMTGEAFYSVHNDTDADAELLIFSTRARRAARPSSRTTSGRS